MVFEKHPAPWIGRFFADLERAELQHLLDENDTLRFKMAALHAENKNLRTENKRTVTVS